MENKKKGLNLRAIIPLATAIVSLVFIVVGLKDYGFWKAQRRFWTSWSWSPLTFPSVWAPVRR